MTDFKKMMKALDRWLDSVSDEYVTAFDQWLNEVRADAWEEGHETAAMRVPEGVWHDTASPRTPNPYRKERTS